MEYKEFQKAAIKKIVNGYESSDKNNRFLVADEVGLVIDDPDHSEQEDRFIILGQSNQAKLLVVCHCYRESDTVIRIISARKATKTESSQYFDF